MADNHGEICYRALSEYPRCAERRRSAHDAEASGRIPVIGCAHRSIIEERRLGTITLSWSQVLVIVVVALGLYVVELLSFMRSARRQSANEKQAAERLDAMSAEIAALRERLDGVSGTVDGLRRMPQSSGQYREAVEMAERGLDAAAVAESCGISRGEADLIVALHRSRAV